MVSKEGNVEGILDWESAGFYPLYWIALKLCAVLASILLSTKPDNIHFNRVIICSPCYSLGNCLEATFEVACPVYGYDYLPQQEIRIT